MSGYTNTRNEKFSLSPKKFFLRGVDSAKGQGARYLDRLTNPFTYTNRLENARNAEGNVYINGRLLTGIFQGFQLSGGLYTEKFDQKKNRILTEKETFVNEQLSKDRVRLKAKKYLQQFPTLLKNAEAQAEKLTSKNKVVEQVNVFQIDKGVKPITGSASFVLLDDDYSTSFEKAKEFVSILTSWEEGMLSEQNGQKIKRVFMINSYLIGAGKPFNFSAIKIKEYNIDQGNRIAGRLDASFTFEQFEIFKGEFEPRKPLTEPNEADAGKQIDELETLENPVLAGIAV